MHYRVRHTTTYTYADSVDLASHLVHLSPRPLSYQNVIHANLVATPTPLRMTEGKDHFGNHIAWIFFDQPHSRFEVTLHAQVDVLFPKVPDPVATPPWEDVAAAAREGGSAGWQAAEFAFESPMVGHDASAAAYAAESFPPMRPVLEGLLDLNKRIKKDFAFRAGVTNVYTQVSKVMAQRAGVCQDFAHVMICGLRSLGLPARYTSGYLRTYPAPGTVPRLGADQSHAWVGCWLGPEHGWMDLDPTNDLVVHDEHVVLGWGRDYGDVSPVRGVLLGGRRHTVSAGVDLIPETEVGKREMRSAANDEAAAAT
jgi:transglutaminase-like putative cysteine protease